jgi:chorismate--pyruvate lyase
MSLIWHPANYYLQKIPPNLHNWLLNNKSLTKRIQNNCDGIFRVELQYQNWQYPLNDEAKLLGIKPRTYALIRQAYLLCKNQIYVSARTVIPAKTLSGKQCRLAKLGNQPLGRILFANHTMRRGKVEITQLQQKHLLFQLALGNIENKPNSLWGRRSIFYLENKPLLVNEFFLPNINKII